LSKGVWIALLSNLNAQHFIDRVPAQGFQEVSLNALISLAKRIAEGPQSWSRCNPSPIISHQICLHPLSQDQSFAFTDKAKLLPGGRFLFFTHLGRLRCWSVIDDRLVWEYQGQWDSYQVREFAAEVVESGQAGVVIIGICVIEALLPMCVFYFFCVSSSVNRRSSHRFVEIVRLDFSREISHSIFVHRAPDMFPGDDNPFSSPQICGDFAIIQLTQYLENEFLLLRLSTKSCCSFAMETLRSVSNTSLRVLFFDGHLLLSARLSN